ncbi:MAG: hypothetical protein QM731_08130 [Chitinophagaceae bacterium]
MKINRYSVLLCSALAISSLSVQAQDESSQDSTGLPGDNFSLAGALELFKKAASPEQFEKLLNSEDNKVNNLDLNGDGQIDYIRVIDKKENDVHVLVLQAVVSDKENQDIAVIELEKTGNENAVLQIVGDEDIFGEETIVEPDGENSSAMLESADYLAAHGPNSTIENTTTGIIVNVWAWPCVRFVYAPAYTVWASPFTWIHRPIWWRPWRPLAWHVYHPFRVRYRATYVVAPVHRVTVARTIYRPVRVTSVTVRTRNEVAVNNYRVTRTKQTRTVTNPRNGNEHKVTRRSTTVEGPRGNSVTRKSTRVRRRG